WGYRTVLDALGDIPGFAPTPAFGEVAWAATVRAQNHSLLLLHDGVSLFDPAFNLQALRQQLPLESIKRLEVGAGPGGVLWGADAFLGIVNVMTKDAEDVDGVEGSVGFTDGRGDRSDLRGYVMVGRTFADGRLKLFLHASYENYLGPELE